MNHTKRHMLTSQTGLWTFPEFQQPQGKFSVEEHPPFPVGPKESNLGSWCVLKISHTKGKIDQKQC